MMFLNIFRRISQMKVKRTDYCIISDLVLVKYFRYQNDSTILTSYEKYYICFIHRNDSLISINLSHILFY
jgi:hypothetical protein